MGCSSQHVSTPLDGLYSFHQQEFNPCTCRAPEGFQGPGPGRGFRLGSDCRWLTGKTHMTGDQGIPISETYGCPDVCWMPYVEHRGVRGFDLILSYNSQLRWGQIVVYVRPERVLRQFDYIQNVPPPSVCDSLVASFFRPFGACRRALCSSWAGGVRLHGVIFSDFALVRHADCIDC